MSADKYGHGIPAEVIEDLARTILPSIRKFFESEEAQREFVEWKEQQASYRMGEQSLHVLKNINLEVDRAEYLTIPGPSGSGKTTLMNILGCMDTLDSGQYRFEDIDVHDCNDDQMTWIRNKKVGFIFQKYHLIPQYTALQNIIMPLLLRGTPRAQAVENAKQVIDLVGLSDRIQHKPNELSGGQQQRVAIARALVTQPSLLLADEPPDHQYTRWRFKHELELRKVFALAVQGFMKLENSLKYLGFRRFDWLLVPCNFTLF